MSEIQGYWSKPWAMLKRDKGWWKILLVMGVATFVPIVGPLGVMGYCLEWARLTAWGVDAAPKQKNVGVGQCIKAGWRGFCAIIGWGTIYGILNAVVFGDSSGLIGIIGFLISVLVGVVLTVCEVRATIYQDFKAGYQVKRIYEMLKADFKGVLQVAGVQLVMIIVGGIALAVLSQVVLIPAVLTVGYGALSSLIQVSSGYYDAYDLYYAFSNIIVAVLPEILLIIYIALVFWSFYQLITTTAVALWISQFNVPAWGASSDPLPERIAPTAVSVQTPTPAPVMPVDPVATQAGAMVPREVAEQPAVNPVPEPVVEPAPAPTSVAGSAPAPTSASAASPVVVPILTPVAPEPVAADGVADEEVIPLAVAPELTPVVESAPVATPEADEIPIVPVAAPASPFESATEEDENDEKNITPQLEEIVDAGETVEIVSDLPADSPENGEGENGADA